MTTMEASDPFRQTTKEEASAMERDWIVAKETVEEHGFIPTCRFVENCDGLLRGDGCPACDFVRGVAQDYVE